MEHCPECCDNVRVLPLTVRVMTSYGVYEPFGVWKTCENCSGSGEIEAD